MRAALPATYGIVTVLPGRGLDYVITGTLRCNWSNSKQVHAQHYIPSL